MQWLQIDRFGRIGIAEYVRCTLKQMSLRLGDLVGMQIKLLTQLRHCFVLAQRGKCHLRFECAGVLPACTFGNAGPPLQLDHEILAFA
jgi:hypothetical protein